MRQGIATGLAISALVHAGVFFSSILIPHHPALKPPPETKLPDHTIIVAPLPPEEPEQQDTTDRTNQPVSVPAPMLPDTPRVAAPTDPVQQIEPPLPDTAALTGDVYQIPDGPRGLVARPQKIFDPNSLDEQPMARLQSAPQYPFEMKRTGQTGTVVVDFIVDANGDVRNAYAARSTQREFEQAAVQAVRKWKFKPGLKGGRAVNTHMQVPIVFSLDGN